MTIKIINEAESHYHQSLNNKENTWGIFWFDGEFGCAIGGFKTSLEAHEFWNEFKDFSNE